jgi:hypothetical protein
MDVFARVSCVVLLTIVLLPLGACRDSQSVREPEPLRPQTAAVPAQVPEPPLSSAVAFTPPPPAYMGELPPFPTSPYPAPRPPDVIRAVYTFAARHPEVLHYVPCFCGCQRSGHSDNDDCFISGREPNGRPIWDAHGMT